MPSSTAKRAKKDLAKDTNLGVIVLNVGDGDAIVMLVTIMKGDGVRPRLHALGEEVKRLAPL